MGVQRSRIGEVCRGILFGISIDALVSMAARAGCDRCISQPDDPD